MTSSRHRGDAIGGAVIAGLILSVALAPQRAGAQDDGEEEAPASALTWGVRPSSAAGPDGRDAFIFELDPGETVEDHVAVANLSEQSLTFAVYASDAFTTADGGFDLLAGNQVPEDVGAWVRFEDEQVTIPARSRADIPFQLTVPSDATPGDHAGGIVATLRTTEEAAAGAEVVVDHRVGARIYLQVSGELVPGVEIEQLDASYDSSLNPLRAGALTATYTVANTGNVRLAATAEVRATGPFGALPRTAEAPPIVELLPGDELSFAVDVAGVQPLGRANVEVTLVPRAVGTNDVSIDPVTAQTRTWAIPWLYVGVLLLALGVVWARRRRQRRRRARTTAALEAARAEGRAESRRESAALVAAGDDDPPPRQLPPAAS